MALNINEVKKIISDFSNQDTINNNLFLRSLGKPASSYDGWDLSIDADGVPILARNPVSSSDPNVKASLDLFSNITETKASYFASDITRIYTDDIPDEVKKRYKENDRFNSISTIYHNLATSCAGWGVTYTLDHLVDVINEDGEAVKIDRIKQIPAWNAKVIFNKETNLPAYGIIYSLNTKDKKNIIWLYDHTTVFRYEASDKSDNYKLVEENLHGYKQIPLIEWKNNPIVRGNAEKAVALLDAYDTCLSDNSTENASFRNAYLMLKNMGIIDEQTKANMKKDSVIIADGEDAEVKFVTKDINPEFVKLVTEQLWSSIWITASSVDPKAISSLSGATAFQIGQMFRLMEQDSKTTERQWNQSLELRDRLLKSYWRGLDTNSVENYNTFDIEYKFVRNVPQDIVSDLEAIKRAGGIVPNAYILQHGLRVSEQEAIELDEDAKKDMTDTLFDE